VSPNDRIDLLVVPPDTGGGTADAAMILAATANNLVHARDIPLTVGTPTTRPIDAAEDAWEAEGGHIRPIPTRAWEVRRPARSIQDTTGLTPLAAGQGHECSLSSG
jgi:hypothetical protein